MLKRAPKQPQPPDGLAPLDEIRQEEADIARSLLLARRQAASIQQETRQQAEQIKERARQNALRDGAAAGAAKISESEREAERIVAQARASAQAAAALAETQVASAVDWAERLVLGQAIPSEPSGEPQP